MQDFVVFGKWRLSCDPDATGEAHAGMLMGAPEACGCIYCRNFATARNKVYPPEILSVFDKLGINPARESEVYEMGRLKPGLRLYGGWIHFVGAIESEGTEIGPFDMEQGEEKPFRMFFANSQNVLPEPFGNQPIVQFEFVAHVRWLLKEAEPD
jgi:hypothetical protein